MSTNLNGKVSVWESLVAKAHQIVHGGSTESVETDGGPVRSFAKLMADKDAEINDRYDGAIEQAETAAGTAMVAKAAAELYALQAAAATRGRPSIAAALADATIAVGQSFTAPLTDGSLQSYMKDSGILATAFGLPFPTAAALAAMLAKLPNVYSERFAAFLNDASGRAALTVALDGAVRASSFSSDSYSGVLEAVIQAIGAAFPGASATGYRDYEFLLADALGQVGLALKTDGTTQVRALETRQINGIRTNTILNRRALGGGNYTAELNGINCTGQSLCESSGIGPALTTAQEYDNIGFPYAADAPTAYISLTPANTAPPPSIGDPRESPMYGTCGFIKELIGKERALDPVAINYQLIACNNGYGSNLISQLSKGAGKYEKAVSQIQAAFNIATAEGRSYKFRATTWIQGESDGAANNYANYLAALKKVALDYNLDTKAITGQTEDAILITYQTTTIAPSGPNVPLAQLAAAIEDPLIYMACPLYQFDFSPDGVHLRSESSKWLGAYMGLVYTRVVVDGEDWSPVRPLSHTKSGNAVYLKFHVPVKPLVIDTVGVPAQPNYGFSAVDAGGAAIAVTGVKVVGNDTVKVTTASPIPVGGMVRYAQALQTGKYAYIGGAGNLRDSQGDRLIYEAINKPMHNWSVFFNYVIA